MSSMNASTLNSHRGLRYYLIPLLLCSLICMFTFRSPSTAQSRRNIKVKAKSKVAKNLLGLLDESYSQDKETRPTIYTFYRDKDKNTSFIYNFNEFLKTDSMLRLWMESWAEAGWKPMVLTMQNARDHPDFEKFDDLIKQKKLTDDDTDLKYYRYLAMTVVGGGWFSEQHIFPLLNNAQKVNSLPNNGAFTIHDDYSFLYSGNKNEWYRIMKVLLRDLEGPNNMKMKVENLVRQKAKHSVSRVWHPRADLSLQHDSSICRITKRNPYVSLNANEVIRSGYSEVDNPAIARTWIRNWKSTCVQNQGRFLSHRFGHSFLMFLDGLKRDLDEKESKINLKEKESKISAVAVDDYENLRYLTFGTSITWGAKLENRNDAYPWLLSPSVTNLAIRGSDPNYASICTQSLVGDAIYDVVVIEYFYGLENGYLHLAERLRERFPDATIILLRMWTPHMLVSKEDRKYTIVDWLKDKGYEQNILEANEAYLKGNITWTIHEYVVQVTHPVQEKTVKKTNAYLYDFMFQRNPEKLLYSIDSFYVEDKIHLSKKGHAIVADGIKELIRSVKPQRSDRVGTWGSGDSCHSWFATGNCTLNYSSGVTMKRITWNKHGLEFPAKGGNITVVNPMNEPRNLVLSFMITCPAPSIYPRTEVVRVLQNTRHPLIKKQPQRVLINPVQEKCLHPVHISSSKCIGKIAPGETNLFIHPLESTTEQFRLISVAVVGNDAVFGGKFAEGYD